MTRRAVVRTTWRRRILSAGALMTTREVEIFRVNWQDTDQRVLMRAGRPRRGEARGRGLQRRSARAGCITCSSRRGGCSITPAMRIWAMGAAVSIRTRRRAAAAARSWIFKARGGSRRAGSGVMLPGWFTHGLLTFTSGAASGQKIEVKLHAQAGDVVTLELWSAGAAAARGWADRSR